LTGFDSFRPTSGKDGILNPQIKQLTEAALGSGLESKLDSGQQTTTKDIQVCLTRKNWAVEGPGF